MNQTVIEVRTSPHLHSGRSVDVIMRNVVYALLPIAAYSIWLFGLSAAALLALSTASCLLAEHLICRISNRETSINDFSAMITGILLGLVLPPGLPLWMAAIGGFVAILPGKMLFGGLGFNVFNPALVARAFLQAAFPTAIMGYTQPMLDARFTQFIPSSLAAPFMKGPSIASFTSATPLTSLKFDHAAVDTAALLWGFRSGSLGETCAPLIFLCGLYLILRKFMDWRIPAAMLLGVALVGGIFYAIDPAAYPSPTVQLLSGGLMLGAMFMATDPVSSPVTPRGMWIYGFVMAVITVLIRLLGGLAEGVMYAILLGNALSPLIDNLTQPRTYGERKANRKPAKEAAAV